jgi:amidase
VLADLGCRVEDAEPDWSGADEAFQLLRAWSAAHAAAALPDAALAAVKDTVRWNIEKGRALSGADVSRGEALRTAVYHRVREFMDDYEFLALPVNQVPPFDVSVRYPREIEGVSMDTYIDWMKSAYYVTVTGHPAISVPCGFTPEGLPVGLQLVGRHRDDFGVLQLAYAFQEATGLWRRRPPI